MPLLRAVPVMLSAGDPSWATLVRKPAGAGPHQERRQATPRLGTALVPLPC